MSIIIGADIVPTKSNLSYFIGGTIENIIDNDLLETLNSVDFRIFNLEVPLCDICKPIKKCGPNLSAPKNVVIGLKKLKIDLFCLANNHIMDQDEQGLNSTVKALIDNNIGYIGAAEDLSKAQTPYYFKSGGKVIGIYACADHEFSIATEFTAGANPFDPLESLDHISNAKKNCDFMIVLYHGGVEHYRLPSPYLQKVCRRIVEKGADLVICQHSHCVGCEEVYGNAKIIYGQGNFLFDYCQDECWQTGILLKLDDEFNLEYIPIVKNKNGVRIADINEKMTILEGFQSRSKKIMEPQYISTQFSLLAKQKETFYLNSFHGRKTLIDRVLNRISKGKWNSYILKFAFNNNYRMRLINNIECEAHRELILNSLKKF